jgi:hypothetical protein
MFHKIMKNIISDLMKVPLEGKGEHGAPSHGTKVEIIAHGKPTADDEMSEAAEEDAEHDPLKKPGAHHPFGSKHHF